MVRVDHNGSALQDGAVIGEDLKGDPFFSSQPAGIFQESQHESFRVEHLGVPVGTDPAILGRIYLGNGRVTKGIDLMSRQ